MLKNDSPIKGIMIAAAFSNLLDVKLFFCLISFNDSSIISELSLVILLFITS
tara:strand:+ start:253 stop:408 length:156 start_codon:yes stop_codon:yes gene_type:complete